MVVAQVGCTGCKLRLVTLIVVVALVGLTGRKLRLISLMVVA
jgi:hypothetical protein